jgi:hypothetical protein
MFTLESQLTDDIEQDDRMITVFVIMIIYPELSVKDVFEMLEDPLLLETFLIELESILSGPDYR